jgi:hypothetical protein
MQRLFGVPLPGLRRIRILIQLYRLPYWNPCLPIFIFGSDLLAYPLRGRRVRYGLG